MADAGVEKLRPISTPASLLQQLLLPPLLPMLHL
jgi:hypothetical protein